MQTTVKNSRLLISALWIAQLLLSVTFAWAAYTKLFTPAEELARMWPWTAENPVLVKLTGIVDLLAAAGLILPSIFKVQLRLVVFAAIGTIVLMAAASIFHISRGEASLIGINIVCAAIAAFIVWGRTRLSTRIIS